jgi:hypothetical protein
MIAGGRRVEQEILAYLKKTVLDYEIEKSEFVTKDAISRGPDPIKCAEALTEAIRQIVFYTNSKAHPM